MKKILVIAIMMSLVLLGGCFTSKKDDTAKKDETAKVQSSEEVLAALVQLSNEAKRGVVGAETANGLKAGVYIKVGGTTCIYTFASIVGIANSASPSAVRTEFMDRWNAATDASSYVIVGALSVTGGAIQDKAINLTVAKSAINAQTLLSDSLAVGTTADDAFKTGLGTLLVEYPAAVTVGAITRGADITLNGTLNKQYSFTVTNLSGTRSVQVFEGNGVVPANSISIFSVNNLGAVSATKTVAILASSTATQITFQTYSLINAGGTTVGDPVVVNLP